MSQQHNQQQKQEPQPPWKQPWDGTTVFWYSTDEPDRGMAEDWIVANVDGVGKTVLLAPGELRLDQLGYKTRVFVLKRNNALDRSQRKYVNGETVVETKHGPIFPSEPLYGRDFWRELVAGNPQFGGRIDHEAFVRETGRKSSPLLPRYRPEANPGVASLHYA